MIVYWIIFGVIVYVAMAFAVDVVFAYRDNVDMSDPDAVIPGIFWPVTIIVYIIIHTIGGFISYCVREYIQKPIAIHYMRKEITGSSRVNLKVFWREKVSRKFCKLYDYDCEKCPLKQYSKYFSDSDCRSWRNETARNYILNFCGFTNFEEN